MHIVRKDWVRALLLFFLVQINSSRKHTLFSRICHRSFREDPQAKFHNFQVFLLKFIVCFILQYLPGIEEATRFFHVHKRW